MKRKDYTSWDDFFMETARQAAERSKDPDTQCGAVIVDPSNNRLVSVGYNGLPRGLDDNGVNVLMEYMPEPFLMKQLADRPDTLIYDYWTKPDKYEFSVHSEENAILNANEKLEGFIIYVYSSKGYYPCSKCARDIMQVGIVEVIIPYAIVNDTPTYNWDFTKHMFKHANIGIRTLANNKEEWDVRSTRRS